MRKFLWAVAVGALVLTLAVPAMALDFKFGAEYRVRFYDGVNIGFNNDAVPNTAFANTQVGPNARGVQIRVRPRFDVSDDNGNITATWRAEIGDEEFGNGGGAFNNTNFGNPIGAGTNRIGNGAGAGGGTDGVNVETKWIYIDFAMPFNIPLRVRAGLQPLYLPKGMVIDDDGAGVRGYGKMDIFSYDLWWWRLSGGMATNGASTGLVPCTIAPGVVVFTSTAAACAALGGVAGTPIAVTGSTAAPTLNTVDNNYDVYGIKLDAALHKWFNPGLYYLYVDNRINCVTAAAQVLNNGGCITSSRTRTSNYVGLTVTGALPFGNYDIDWIYGQAKGGPSGAFGGVNTPIDVRGWALDGHVGFPIGPVVLNFAGMYGTGDRRDGGNSEAFPGGLAPSWNGPGGGYEMIGSGGPFDAVEFTQDGLTNLWAIGAWVEYRPIKALWLKLAYAYVGFANKSGNCGIGVVANANPCYGPAYQGKGYNAVTGLGGLAGKSTLGQEISLRADYDVWTGFKVQGQVGWFVPTKGDTAGEYVLQLLYNF